jgi:hypothetical protein
VAEGIAVGDADTLGGDGVVDGAVDGEADAAPWQAADAIETTAMKAMHPRPRMNHLPSSRQRVTRSMLTDHRP